MSQDAKKEEFKKYLEKAGVLELLTKSLVSLYEEPEKPGDAVNYLKKTVGGTDNDKQEIEKLQTENTELKAKIAALEESQNKLQEKLAELEKGQTAAPAAVTEATPEPEPTKEAEKTEVEAPAETTEEPKAVETSADEPMEAETAAPV